LHKILNNRALLYSNAQRLKEAADDYQEALQMGAIERGETNVTLSTLISLADRLETRIAEFLDEAD
jgi:hypothetical protein